MPGNVLRARPADPVPLEEVSGLALGVGPGGHFLLLAISDRTAEVAHARLSPDSDSYSWSVADLTALVGTRIPGRDPQLEAVAADGADGVLVLQENPPRAEYGHVGTRSVSHGVSLAMPTQPVGPRMQEVIEAWADPDASHGEGVVLLREGHLLVALEKRPTALLEFGPAGAAPLGFGDGAWLGPGESWVSASADGAPGSDVLEGSTAAGAGEAEEMALVALAAWFPDEALAIACPDISDLSRARDGGLWVLSDKGCSLAYVPATTGAADPFEGSVTASALFRLDGVPKKPEGLVELPGGDLLVACDRRGRVDNLFRLPRPPRDG